MARTVGAARVAPRARAPAPGRPHGKLPSDPCGQHASIPRDGFRTAPAHLNAEIAAPGATLGDAPTTKCRPTTLQRTKVNSRDTSHRTDGSTKRSSTSPSPLARQGPGPARLDSSSRPSAPETLPREAMHPPRQLPVTVPRRSRLSPTEKQRRKVANRKRPMHPTQAASGMPPPSLKVDAEELGAVQASSLLFHSSPVSLLNRQRTQPLCLRVSRSGLPGCRLPFEPDLSLHSEGRVELRASNQHHLRRARALRGTKEPCHVRGPDLCHNSAR